MCIVSAVTDDYMKRWPEPNMGGMWITFDQWQEYQRLKRNAEELDRILGQPDCVKDGVDEWEQKMEEFLRKKGLLP